jgi:hypothetical protein
MHDGTGDERSGQDRGGAPPQRRRWPAVIASVAAVVVVALIGVVAWGLFGPGRERPTFPSLVAQPDPSLHGTVAYVDDRSGCVRLIAVSGAASREVLCLPPFDPADAQAKGKPTGPQLVWRDDTHLEVTMFRMTDTPGPDLRAGWQKVVDVRTGAVVDTPAAEVPGAADLGTRPTVGAGGERIETESDAASGHVVVRLVGADGNRRTLLDVRGPGEYTYGLVAAFWGPDGRTVFVDDGSILVVTTGAQPVVRTLTDQSRNVVFGADDPLQSRFAVTPADLLSD